MRLPEPLDAADFELDASLPPAALRGALEARQRFLAKYRPIMAGVEQEVRLISQLLALRESTDETAGERLPLTIAQTREGTPPPRSRHPVVDEVAQLLESEEHPIHISEIMRLLLERGVSLPGKGDQANVIAHLRRDPRFVRPSRGVYGLASWGLRSTTGDDGPRRRIKKRVTGA